jgi:hypothetical protein
MKITIEANGEEFEVVEVDPRTLRATDSQGEPVVLFPRPGEHDMTTLPTLLQEAMNEEGERYLSLEAERRHVRTRDRQAKP